MATGGHDGHLGAVYDARAPEEVAAVYDAWASTYDEEMAKAGYRHPAVGLALVMLAICGGIYSATVTGISGALFPQQANGSLISQNGKLVGSALVAQAIDDARGGGNSGRILSPRGSVIFEQRTNQLFVTDIPSRLEQVQELITKLDIPIRQVLIEARIVEADDDFSKSIGVRLGGGVRGFSAGSINGNAVQGNFGSTYAAVGAGPTLASSRESVELSRLSPIMK